MMGIADLVGQFGSPLYVFDDKGFVDNIQHLCRAFRNVYPNYVPGYSYKTNYTPHICRLVKDLGGYAEVVSDMELWLAKQIGYSDDRIIYNGPDKGPGMQAHILSGGISNIDNEEEAARVIALAKANPDKQLKVGIRINADIGLDFISRFGVDVESEGMKRIVEEIALQPNLSLAGFHMHVSRARYIEAWQRRIDSILCVADTYLDETPDYIDVGSGMFADMEISMQEQFTGRIPSYEDYAGVVAGAMASHYGKSEKKPLLLSEPGTTVVSRYMSLLTRVKSVKTIRGRHIAVLDCDFHNAGETPQMIKVPYSHLRCGHGMKSGTPVDLTGDTCLEQDCIYGNFPDAVRVGDIMELRNVGGYSIVMKPPFIQPNCAVVAIHMDGSAGIVKRQETFEDIFQTYVF